MAEQKKPREPDLIRRPGEDELRATIDKYVSWNVYAVDYVSEMMITILYLETDHVMKFRDAYDRIVQRKFLARIEAADNSYANDPAEAASKIVAEANRQRIYAGNCARPR